MSVYMSARSPENWHLVRKVLLLLFLVVAWAFGLVLLLQRSNPVPPLIFNLLADGSIGALMGLGSRFVLRRRHWLLRSLVSAALSIVGLLLVGFLTDYRGGIGPVNVELARVTWLDRAGIALQLPLLPGNSPTDLVDVAQLVVAMNVSWIALRAWPSSPYAVARRLDSGVRVRTAAAAPAPVRMYVPATASMPAARSAAHSRARPLVRRRKIGRPAVSNAIAIRPRIAGNRRGELARRRPGVQLATYEKHRCPYCLEDVKREDSRGWVECPVCRTLHHKDCWDITGTCQVPHLND